MKALFAHGLKFYESPSKELYLRGYDNAYWQRYLKHFDRISVIGRTVSLGKETQSGYSKFDNKDLKFVEVPEIHNAQGFIKNNKLSREIIESEIVDADYVIARLPGTYSVQAIKICQRLRKPYIVELVGCPWDALTTHSIKGKLAAPIITLSTKEIVKKAPFVVYVTKYYLQKKYPTNGISTNCSNVTLPSIDSVILDNRIDRIKKTSSDQKLKIGTIGAIDVIYKGQEYVIKALGELKKEGVNKFEYQLVGGGSQGYLSKIVRSNNLNNEVTFLGSMTREQIFDWLDDIDIYIQPSLTEGLPRALIEAMSRGTLSLGSEVGGIPELLNPNFLFKPKSVVGIKDRLKQIGEFDFEKEAQVNFYKCMEYDPYEIEKRRDQIFKEFIKTNQ